MFKGDGALATLAQRIDAAHGMKLIDDVTREDAHLVRRIRNKFAHAKEEMHFEDAQNSPARPRQPNIPDLLGAPRQSRVAIKRGIG